MTKALKSLQNQLPTAHPDSCSPTAQALHQLPPAPFSSLETPEAPREPPRQRRTPTSPLRGTRELPPVAPNAAPRGQQPAGRPSPGAVPSRLRGTRGRGPAALPSPRLPSPPGRPRRPSSRPQLRARRFLLPGYRRPGRGRAGPRRYRGDGSVRGSAGACGAPRPSSGPAAPPGAHPGGGHVVAPLLGSGTGRLGGSGTVSDMV